MLPYTNKTLSTMQRLKADHYDIVALQEPHIKFLGWTWANPHWMVIYPKQHLINPKKTRSVILINRRISTNNWENVNIVSNDVTGICLHGPFGSICVLNIYNDCNNNKSLEVVEEYMKRKEGRWGAGVRGHPLKFIPIMKSDDPTPASAPAFYIPPHHRQIQEESR